MIKRNTEASTRRDDNDRVDDDFRSGGALEDGTLNSPAYIHNNIRRSGTLLACQPEMTRPCRSAVYEGGNVPFSLPDAKSRGNERVPCWEGRDRPSPVLKPTLD